MRQVYLHQYARELISKTFEGVAICGFDLGTNKFQSAWVDSFQKSTAIMLSEGDALEPFSASGTFYAGEDFPRWGWRIEIAVIGDDNIVLTTCNVSPEGEETKETWYLRKV